ncbi:MAG: hypothetical protein R2706_09730 [Acidimicrobiales bacterium]
MAGTDSLAPGASATVSLTVTFTPDSATVENQGTVTGVGRTSGKDLTDITDSGLDADADGDRDPGSAVKGDPDVHGTGVEPDRRRSKGVHRHDRITATAPSPSATRSRLVRMPTRTSTTSRSSKISRRTSPLASRLLG